MLNMILAVFSLVILGGGLIPVPTIGKFFEISKIKGYDRILMPYQGWKKSLFGAERITINTSDDKRYIPLLDYGIDIRQVERIKFGVNACHNVHVALAEEENNFVSKTLQIVIGGLKNWGSGIWEDPSDIFPDKQNKGAVLNCPQTTWFSISWSNGKIRVWSISDEKVVIEYKKIPHPFNYIGISTGFGATGIWYFDKPDPSVTSLTTQVKTGDPVSLVPITVNNILKTYALAEFGSYYEVTSMQLFGTTTSVSTSVLVNCETDLSNKKIPVTTGLLKSGTIGLSKYSVQSESTTYDLSVKIISTEPFMDIMTSSPAIERGIAPPPVISNYVTTEIFTDIMTSSSAIETGIAPPPDISNYVTTELFTDIMTSSPAIDTGIAPFPDISNYVTTELVTDIMTSSPSIVTDIHVVRSSDILNYFTTESFTNIITSSPIIDTGKATSSDISNDVMTDIFTEIIDSSSVIVSDSATLYNFDSKSNTNTSVTVTSSYTNNNSIYFSELKGKSTKRMCPCKCLNLKNSKKSLNKKIHEIQKKLSVNQSQLSSTKRKLTSITDNSPSSVSLGTFGITLMVLTLIALTGFDVLKLCLFCVSRTRFYEPKQY